MKVKIKQANSSCNANSSCQAEIAALKRRLMTMEVKVDRLQRRLNHQNKTTQSSQSVTNTNFSDESEDKKIFKKPDCALATTQNDSLGMLIYAAIEHLERQNTVNWNFMQTYTADSNQEVVKDILEVVLTLAEENMKQEWEEVFTPNFTPAEFIKEMTIIFKDLKAKHFAEPEPKRRKKNKAMKLMHRVKCLSKYHEVFEQKYGFECQKLLEKTTYMSDEEILENDDLFGLHSTNKSKYKRIIYPPSYRSQLANQFYRDLDEFMVNKAGKPKIGAHVDVKLNAEDMKYLPKWAKK